MPACFCEPPRLNSARMMKAMSPRLRVPKGGWNARSFAAQGHLLMPAMARAAKIVQWRAIPGVAAAVKGVLVKQMEKVIAWATDGKKSTGLTLEIMQSEEIWRQAIEDVLRETGSDVLLTLKPKVQSVMAQGYSKTNLLLGEPDYGPSLSSLASRAQGIAERISGVNGTTKRMFERIVTNALEEGNTVVETARIMREKIPGLASSRSVLIARTEMNNAYTQGAAQSFKESSSIAELSVIGCQSREEDKWGDPGYPWIFDGESTCNFTGIPLHRLDEFVDVGFHPNHTGVIVASAFREEE